MSFRSLIPVSMLTFAIAANAFAVTARFDIGSPIVQPGWDLVDATGVGSAGPIGVSMTPVGAGVTLMARDRGFDATTMLPINGGGAEVDMWRDFVFANASNDPGEGLDIHLSGLAPSATYPVRIWSFDDVSNHRAALWNGRVVGFSDGPDPTSLDMYDVSTFIQTDAAGNAVLRGRTIANNQEPIHVFINGLEIGDPTGAAPPPIPVTPRVIAIDIDSTFSGAAVDTAPGFVSLDATNGDEGHVVVGNTLVQVFSADGSRDRTQSADPLVRDFIFDDGASGASGLRFFNLPDGLWDVEVWAFDALVPNTTGAQIVGISQTGIGEIILTDSFLPNPTDPFTFRIDSSTLEQGFGIFTRENNDANRSRFNAIRLTQVVPEPGTALLALLGLAGIARRRRRTA